MTEDKNQLIEGEQRVKGIKPAKVGRGFVKVNRDICKTSAMNHCLTRILIRVSRGMLELIIQQESGS